MSIWEQFVNSINVLFAPIAILIILIADYSRRYVDDVFRRKMFVAALVSTLIAVLSDLVYDVFAGMPGTAGYVIIYASCFSYYFFQVMTYNLTLLFIDYQINKDRVRTRRLARGVAIVAGVHLLALLANIYFGFYFVVIPGENVYAFGNLYVVRLLFSYLPGVLSFANLFLSHRNAVREHALLLSCSFFLMAVGSTLDLLLPGFKLNWPCFCAALLFAYSFIIHAEAHTDALTGIHNRRSCEDYLRGITQSARRPDYYFIMIDLDRFKSINDSLGHVEGDQALHDAAQLIRRSFRKMDFVARYGGDEFLIITQATNVEMLIERLHAGLARFNSEHKKDYELHISVGYDKFAANAVMTPQECIAHVDALMYAKKKQKESRRQNDKQA